MKQETTMINGREVDVWSLNTVVVGSGAAGWNAADHVFNLGQTDVAVVTEGVNMGTSRNTGSDKQTYYKLTLAGDTGDSVMEMARTLFSGGARHGDVALVEAALSPRCFYKLVEIGVDFPHNRFGEYVGYKTDHDPRQRATSIGPLTSKVMTEKLERQVRAKGIKIFDRHIVIGILLAEDSRAVGLVAINMAKLHTPDRGITLFNCTNIIYATGGPAGMYAASVYPESQTGSLGIAFEAGVSGFNLTESQYGIASVKFRWNLSGSYQQVIPRYISTDAEGNDAREFLDAYFPDTQSMLTAIFLKGYQWPFDPRKLADYGSSLIDLLIYHEINDKGRRVFIDYRSNPAAATKDGQFDFSLLAPEPLAYLQNSGVLYGTPIERLRGMNQPAVDLYMAQGIDLAKEPLEVAVCAQHSNGGLSGDCWWESNIPHFFPVGEVSGSFGVYRPGGSALNSGQVAGLRAAQYIVHKYRQEPLPVEAFLRAVGEQVQGRLGMVAALVAAVGTDGNLKSSRNALRHCMTKAGAHVRNLREVEEGISLCREKLRDFPGGITLETELELPDAFRYYDMLITQLMYLEAIREYIRKGGQSRGSYIVCREEGEIPVTDLPEKYRYLPDTEDLMKQICEIRLQRRDDWQCSCEWQPVRPIPQEEGWFETLWAAYRSGEVWQK